MEREAIKNDLQALIEYFMDERGASPLCLQECLRMLEQEPCDKYITEIDHLRKYISKLETQIVEQEHCEDCVSRKTAIIQLFHNKTGDDDCDVIIQSDIETIKALPPVTPQQKNGTLDNGKI